MNRNAMEFKNDNTLCRIVAAFNSIKDSSAPCHLEVKRNTKSDHTESSAILILWIPMVSPVDKNLCTR